MRTLDKSSTVCWPRIRSASHSRPLPTYTRARSGGTPNRHTSSRRRRWRRALLDLYTIARWLPQYVTIVKLLPRAIQELGRVRLSDALAPSFSPIWQQAGIEAAPLVRTLGIGKPDPTKFLNGTRKK